MGSARRIALLMGQDIGYTRDVLRGVQSYGCNCPNWVFRDAPIDPRVLTPLAEWKPHGIIAHLFDLRIAKKVIGLGIPIVNVTSTLQGLGVPLVEVNHMKVGQLAADYFIDLGFENFGYYGSSWTGFSKDREKGFRDRLAERGFDVSSCYAEYLPRPPVDESWTAIDQKVRGWLKRLVKPVAIFSSNDVPARALAEICWQLGLKIPEEVALLGVDNDELECQLCRPSLSSVAIPGARIGYEAARLLHGLIEKPKIKCTSIVLDPLEVVTRQSTDTLAIPDPDVAEAVAYIRNHAHEDIGVDSVLKNVPVSRRGLERKFQQHRGRTILTEIRHARLQLVKSLLTHTDLAMPAVASRAGFSGARRMAVVFRQVVGTTPREYRAKSRLKSVSQSET